MPMLPIAVIDEDQTEQSNYIDARLCYKWLYNDNEFQEATQGPSFSNGNLTKMFIKGNSVLKKEIRGARNIESNDRLLHKDFKSHQTSIYHEEVIIEDNTKKSNAKKSKERI